MQLGVRWRAGEPPHRSVPSELRPGILDQEQAHPEAGSWTLTWLEGRPRCALDDLVVVALNAAGTVVIEGGAGGTAEGGFEIIGGADDAFRTVDSEEDEWLR